MATALTVPRGGTGFGRALPGVPRDVVEHGWRLGVITFAIITATLLEIIDVTIVNVALPNIQGNFGASVDQAAWIGTGYIIANVDRDPAHALAAAPLRPARVLLRVDHDLHRRLDRRAASRSSLEQLVFWRIIQGLGGGGLISTSQAILRETYPPRTKGKAAGVFSRWA